MSFRENCDRIWNDSTLKYAEKAVLIAIVVADHNHDGPMTISLLARLTSLSRRTIFKVRKDLAARGLIDTQKIAFAGYKQVTAQ